MATSPMTTDDAARRVQDLRARIIAYQKSYYQEGVSPISDRAYDELFNELSFLEEAFPELSRDDSPTRTVGYHPQRDLDKIITYPTPMYSLENVYTEEGLIAFFSKVSPETLFYGDLKHDGIALKLIYEKGQLKTAALRGTKTQGLDVTPYVSLMRDIPLTISQISHLSVVEICGEGTVGQELFEAINRYRLKEGLTSYATHLSAVVGLFSRKETPRDLLRDVSFTPYAVYGCDHGHNSHSEVIRTLQGWGFKGRESLRFKWQDLSDLRSFYEMFSKTYRNGSDHPIDGIVVRIDDLSLCEKMGYTERAPRFAVAFKFPEVKHCGKIKSVTYTVGRTGMITPVAHLLEPVRIQNVTISYVSLHSIRRVQERGYGPGCGVEVYRAGGVIPAIGDVIIPSEQPLFIPTTCPCCQHPLEINGAHLYCPNKLKCSGIHTQRFLYALGKEALNFEGVGEQTIRIIVDNLGIVKMSDLFRFISSDSAGSYIPPHILNGMRGRLEELCGALRSNDRKSLLAFFMSFQITGTPKKLLKSLVSEGKSFEEILNILGSETSLREKGLSLQRSKEIISSLKVFQSDIMDTYVFMMSHHFESDLEY